MRRQYPTEYLHRKPGSGDARYGSYLLAMDTGDVNRLLQIRGLDEWVSGQACDIGQNPIPIMTRLDRQLDRILTTPTPGRVQRLQHGVMHTLDLAQHDQRFRLESNPFSDTGFLHTLVHLWDYDPQDPLELEHLQGPFRETLTALTDSVSEMFLTEAERQQRHEDM